MSENHHIAKPDIPLWHVMDRVKVKTIIETVSNQG